MEQQQPVETTVYSFSEAPPSAPAERRETVRHMTLFRVGSLQVGDRRELCLIKNISAGGMRVRAYCALTVGDRIEVELKCGVPIRGEVGWVDGTDSGIMFDNAIDVLALLNTSMKGPKPRMPRVEVDCMIGFREGANHRRVRACDISQGGLKIQTDTAMAPGTEVVASVPGLAPIAGTVCWSDGICTGVAFNNPVPLETLVLWIRARHERAKAAN